MPAIGVITFELRIEDSHSLKDKRHFVKGLKDRLRAKCNVAVAEIDYQESWQQGLVAAVTVSSDRARAEHVLQQAEKEAAALLGPVLVEATVEWLA
ncbi:MAG TPA: DUF503 domain-containing protein [Bryobacteraceae bacterium]